MIVAIHQPNFLPWLGFFHKLINSDVFVLFDDVQLPRGKSFCNRVAIKQGGEGSWLTIPISGKSNLIPLKDTQMVNDQPWRRKHVKTLELAYDKAPYFKSCFNELNKLYQSPTSSLVEFNQSLIEMVKEKLNCQTKIVCSSQLNLGPLSGADHIIAIVKALGGEQYLTGDGEGSRRYLAEDFFKAKGVEIVFQKFEHPKYKQLGTEFVPNLSIIDLLLNEGPRARELLLQNNKGEVL